MGSHEFELSPAPGVTVVDGQWLRVGWGVEIPAPPRRISPLTSSNDRAAAELAVNCGMATVRPARHWWTFVPEPLVLPAETVVLSASFARFFVRSLLAFGRIHWLPLVVIVLGLLSGLGAGWQPASLGSLLLLGLLCSLLIHELGHAIAFLAVRHPRQEAVLVITRRSAWLVRPIGSAKLEFIVTVAGPAAPALITLALMPVLLSQSAILIGFTIISAAHVATLAVPSGDGAILRRCIGH